jgi:hypothetical protein
MTMSAQTRDPLDHPAGGSVDGPTVLTLEDLKGSGKQRVANG